MIGASVLSSAGTAGAAAAVTAAENELVSPDNGHRVLSGKDDDHHGKDKRGHHHDKDQRRGRYFRVVVPEDGEVEVSEPTKPSSLSYCILLCACSLWLDRASI